MSGLFQTKEIKRDKRVEFRATSAEKELIAQKAADCGMDTSQYLLSCALGKPIRSKMAATIINELRLLGQQQKDLYQAHQGGEYGEQYGEILKALVAAIERVATLGSKGLDDDS